MAIIKNYTPSRKKYISTDNTQSKLQLMIGGNIFHWRKYRGLSQEELATKAAITQSIVSELENGDYNPSVEILQKIAHALEIEYELLNKQSMNWKMIECIDYLTQKIQDITTLKAMKLLYMIDYESLQQKKEKMTGLEYIRYMWGPFNKAIYDAENIFIGPKKIYTPITFKKNLILEKEDKTFLDTIIKKYGHMEPHELMQYTYTTKPMKGCTIGGSEKMGQKIL